MNSDELLKGVAHFWVGYFSWFLVAQTINHKGFVMDFRPMCSRFVSYLFEFLIFFGSGWRFGKFRPRPFRIFNPIQKIFKTQKVMTNYFLLFFLTKKIVDPTPKWATPLNTPNRSELTTRSELLNRNIVSGTPNDCKFCLDFSVFGLVEITRHNSNVHTGRCVTTRSHVPDRALRHNQVGTLDRALCHN